MVSKTLVVFMLDHNSKLDFETLKRTRQYLTGRHNCLVILKASDNSTLVRLLLQCERTTLSDTNVYLSIGSRRYDL